MAAAARMTSGRRGAVARTEMAAPAAARAAPSAELAGARGEVGLGLGGLRGALGRVAAVGATAAGRAFTSPLPPPQEEPAAASGWSLWRGRGEDLPPGVAHLDGAYTDHGMHCPMGPARLWRYQGL